MLLNFAILYSLMGDQTQSLVNLFFQENRLQDEFSIRSKKPAIWSENVGYPIVISAPEIELNT
jgi:hypothetical protein